MDRKVETVELSFDGADKSLVNEFFYLDDAIRILGKRKPAEKMTSSEREVMRELFAKKAAVLRAIGRSMKK